MQGIRAFLGLPDEAKKTQYNLNMDLDGFGDTSPVSVAGISTNKKNPAQFVTTVIRKFWVLSFLKSIEPRYFTEAGCDKDEMIKQVRQLKLYRLGLVDLFQLLQSSLVSRLFITVYGFKGLKLAFFRPFFKVIQMI